MDSHHVPHDSTLAWCCLYCDAAEQLCRHVLRIVACHPLWHACRNHQHLVLPHFPAHAPGYGRRSQLVRQARLPMPRQSNPPCHPREEVVLGIVGHRHSRRHPSLWIHLYRDVLCVYVVLGVQGMHIGGISYFELLCLLDLLRLRFPAPRLLYPVDRDRMRHHRGNILFAQL